MEGRPSWAVLTHYPLVTKPHEAVPNVTSYWLSTLPTCGTGHAAGSPMFEPKVCQLEEAKSRKRRGRAAGRHGDDVVESFELYLA
jgi:hypothetical protein